MMTSSLTLNSWRFDYARTYESSLTSEPALLIPVLFDCELFLDPGSKNHYACLCL